VSEVTDLDALALHRIARTLMALAERWTVAVAEALLAYPQLADLLGERHLYAAAELITTQPTCRRPVRYPSTRTSADGAGSANGSSSSPPDAGRDQDP
jgi:hypothetical protein